MLTTGIDPLPRAAVEQARRLAGHRQQLLASGAFTTEALRELRRDASRATTRTWISRQRKDGALFTVRHEGIALLPAFQSGLRRSQGDTCLTGSLVAGLTRGDVDLLQNLG